MNTALYVVRALQIGLSIADLEFFTYGAVIDLLTETGNDNCEYDQVAEQSDFDRF